MYIFGASPYASDGTSGTLQAQGSNGAITGLTLTSDTPGTLTVSWDTTSPVPTDHRVDWAKSGEDYQSWKVDDGHKYPAPTATSVTIADLEHDTEYKIRLRTRYYSGEYEGKSWGGPWAEATLQVAGEPETPSNTVTRDADPPEPALPAAPSLINTAVSEGQVLLSWFKPSDDSITGYQILRGPDASNLVVIKDDTGSSSTSYTDTAPPAGQTHTYGVKARNSAGLGPVGTATATVPAAEEELVTARHESAGNTLVTNLGQTLSSTEALIGANLGTIAEMGMPFTTGNNPFGYHITSMQVVMKTFVGGNTNPVLSIRADNGGVPSETLLQTFTTSTTINTNIWQPVTFTTSEVTSLHPNTRYWLHAANTGTHLIRVQNTDSDDEDIESNVDWKIGNNRYYRPVGQAWIERTTGNTRMEISGHPAPAFLVSNLDSPGENLLFFRETDTDTSKLAQSFSAADNTDGTTAEFDFHGVTVLLELGVFLGSQLADSDILATVHRDNGGQPSDLVHTLTAPATYTVLRDSGPITFSASPGSTLSSGITYWVKFEIATDSTFFTGPTSIYFEFATDNNEVQGPTTNNRWTIGHDSLWSPETLAWTTEVRSIKMSVLGAPHYDTLVSNIDQTFLGAEPTGPDVKTAQSFLTPPGPLGQQYRLNAARFNASSLHPTHAMIDLHADDNGVPGDHLASMTMPGNFAPGDTVVADLTVSAPKNTNLNPGHVTGSSSTTGS